MKQSEILNIEEIRALAKKHTVSDYFELIKENGDYDQAENDQNGIRISVDIDLRDGKVSARTHRPGSLYRDETYYVCLYNIYALNEYTEEDFLNAETSCVECSAEFKKAIKEEYGLNDEDFDKGDEQEFKFFYTNSFTLKQWFEDVLEPLDLDTWDNAYDNVLEYYFKNEELCNDSFDYELEEIYSNLED